MGYVYEKDIKTGRSILCCDNCGKSGGVKKFKCPFGWCQARALCPECTKELKPKSKEYRAKHRAKGCETAEKRFQDEKELRASLLASGKWIRKAAVGVDEGVKVWFSRQDGSELEAIMSRETYRSIPLITPATLEDYRSNGEVEVTNE